MTIIHWRRRRDLNSRAGCPTYTLSRGASSPLEYFCIVRRGLSAHFMIIHGIRPLVKTFPKKSPCRYQINRARCPSAIDALPSPLGTGCGVTVGP